MKILICGAQGQVGQELSQQAGTNALALGRKDLDITDARAVDELFARVKPAVVINAAAYTAVDKAETEVESARAINTDAPGHLAAACSSHNAALLHISTDYVFDGRQTAPYKETDPVNPLGSYARSKWQGEERVRALCKQHIILRTSWVFGAHGNNFARTMLRLARERPELRVVADQQGGPTPAAAITRSLLELSNRIVRGEPLPWGTYHYGGAPAITWHGFATAVINEAFALNMIPRQPLIHPITTAEYPLPAPRPANSVFDMRHTQQQLGLSPPDWRAGLQDILKIWSTST